MPQGIDKSMGDWWKKHTTSAIPIPPPDAQEIIDAVDALEAATGAVGPPSKAEANEILKGMSLVKAVAGKLPIAFVKAVQAVQGMNEALKGVYPSALCSLAGDVAGWVFVYAMDQATFGVFPVESVLSSGKPEMLEVPHLDGAVSKFPEYKQDFIYFNLELPTGAINAFCKAMQGNTHFYVALPLLTSEMYEVCVQSAILAGNGFEVEVATDDDPVKVDYGMKATPGEYGVSMLEAAFKPYKEKQMLEGMFSKKAGAVLPEDGKFKEEHDADFEPLAPLEGKSDFQTVMYLHQQIVSSICGIPKDILGQMEMADSKTLMDTVMHGSPFAPSAEAAAAHHAMLQQVVDELSEKYGLPKYYVKMSAVVGSGEAEKMAAELAKAIMPPAEDAPMPGLADALLGDDVGEQLVEEAVLGGAVGGGKASLLSKLLQESAKGQLENLKAKWIAVAEDVDSLKAELGEVCTPTEAHQLAQLKKKAFSAHKLYHAAKKKWYATLYGGGSATLAASADPVDAALAHLKKMAEAALVAYGNALSKANPKTAATDESLNLLKEMAFLAQKKYGDALTEANEQYANTGGAMGASVSDAEAKGHWEKVAGALGVPLIPTKDSTGLADEEKAKSITETMQQWAKEVAPTIPKNPQFPKKKLGAKAKATCEKYGVAVPLDDTMTDEPVEVSEGKDDEMYYLVGDGEGHAHVFDAYGFPKDYIGVYHEFYGSGFVTAVQAAVTVDQLAVSFSSDVLGDLGVDPAELTAFADVDTDETGAVHILSPKKIEPEASSKLTTLYHLVQDADDEDQGISHIFEAGVAPKCHPVLAACKGDVLLGMLSESVQGNGLVVTITAAIMKDLGIDEDMLATFSDAKPSHAGGAFWLHPKKKAPKVNPPEESLHGLETLYWLVEGEDKWATVCVASKTSPDVDVMTAFEGKELLGVLVEAVEQYNIKVVVMADMLTALPMDPKLFETFADVTQPSSAVYHLHPVKKSPKARPFPDSAKSQCLATMAHLLATGQQSKITPHAMEELGITDEDLKSLGAVYYESSNDLYTVSPFKKKGKFLKPGVYTAVDGVLVPEDGKPVPYAPDGLGHFDVKVGPDPDDPNAVKATITGKPVEMDFAAIEAQMLAQAVKGGIPVTDNQGNVIGQAVNIQKTPDGTNGTIEKPFHVGSGGTPLDELLQEVKDEAFAGWPTQTGIIHTAYAGPDDEVVYKVWLLKVSCNVGAGVVLSNPALFVDLLPGGSVPVVIAHNAHENAKPGVPGLPVGLVVKVLEKGTAQFYVNVDPKKYEHAFESSEAPVAADVGQAFEKFKKFLVQPLLLSPDAVQVGVGMATGESYSKNTHVCAGDAACPWCASGSVPVTITEVQPLHPGAQPNYNGDAYWTEEHAECMKVIGEHPLLIRLHSLVSDGYEMLIPMKIVTNAGLEDVDLCAVVFMVGWKLVENAQDKVWILAPKKGKPTDHGHVCKQNKTCKQCSYGSSPVILTDVEKSPKIPEGPLFG